LNNVDYENFTSVSSANNVFMAAVAANILNYNQSNIHVEDIINLTPSISGSSSMVSLSSFGISFFSKKNGVSTQTIPSNLDNIEIQFTLKFFIQSMGYNDVNYALNDVIHQLNNSITSNNHVFLNSLLSSATDYHLLYLFQYCEIPGSSLTFLSVSVNDFGSSSSSKSAEEDFYEGWDLYAQILFIGGGAIVVLALGWAMNSMIIQRQNRSPLNGIHSSLSTREKFMKKLNFSSRHSHAVPLPTTVIQNPATSTQNELSKEEKGVNAGNPPPLEQNFVDLILNDGFYGLQRSQSQSQKETGNKEGNE
jgi:hypothetical protein